VTRIAVVTSGGDAPGMNAATRAVVRSAVARGWGVAGVFHGYTGLMGGDFRPLGLRDVGGIIQQGGTMLGTTRCEMLKTEPGCDGALDALRTHEIVALVVIGGNGSQTGAWELCRHGARVVVLPRRLTTTCMVRISASERPPQLMWHWRRSTSSELLPPP